MNDSAQNKQSTINPEVSTNVLPVKIQPITQQELSGLKFTGITLKIELPLELNSGDFLFAVNTDGFIPPANYLIGSLDGANNVFANMMPVQASRTMVNKIFINQKFLPTYEQLQYLSNRIMQGSVGVVVRLISNVGQAGHLSVTHLTSVQRDFYNPNEQYKGVRFRNMPTDTFAGSLAGFTLIDISTNRNLSIISTNNPTANSIDVNKKLSYIANLTDDSDIDEKEVFASQFLEDWLIFGPTNSMPNTLGTSFELAIYFDYSRVTFLVPIFPVIPTIPQIYVKQILEYTKTYALKEIGSIDQTDLTWLPGYNNVVATVKDNVAENIMSLARLKK